MIIPVSVDLPYFVDSSWRMFLRDILFVCVLIHWKRDPAFQPFHLVFSADDGCGMSKAVMIFDENEKY